MEWLRLGVLSVGAVSTSILLAAITIYLFTTPHKTAETWYLIGYIGVLFLLVLSYAVRYSVFHHRGASTGQVSNLIVFGVACLIQFAYHYRGTDLRTEARIVLVLFFFVAARVWASNFFRGLPIVYDFQAQYFTREYGPRISLVTLAGFLWALIVLLRRTVRQSRAAAETPGRSRLSHLARPEGQAARSMRSFAALTLATTVLSVLYLLFQAGAISRALYALVFNVGALLIALQIFIVYLNNSPRPSSYRAKLVGIPLAVVMVAFTIAAGSMMPSLNGQLSAAYAGRLWSLRSVLESGVEVSVPEDVAFVARHGDRELLYATDPLLAQDASRLVTLPGAAGLFPPREGLQPDFFYLDVRDPASFFIRYTVAVEEDLYTVGFRYPVYRAAVHGFAWRIALTALATTVVVVLGFPAAYNRGLLRPLGALLGGVQRVERGDYQAEIPVTTQDEIGRLTLAFNTMVQAIHQAEGRLQTQQEQLMRADKLASIGVLVTSIAHEVSNPNQVVRLNAAFLAEALPALSSVVAELEEEGEIEIADAMPSGMSRDCCAALQEIRESSDRIQRIVQDLKELATGGPDTRREWTDPNQVVLSVARLARHFLARATSAFSLELAETLPRVWANRIELEQVVLNLLQNAAHALPGRDCRLWIATGCSPAGDRVTIEVCDEGRGIPPRHLARITEPFFTTRRGQGGTGLGLSIADRIVKAHGGELKLESKVGRGTRAAVCLPAEKGTASTGPAAHS